MAKINFPATGHTRIGFWDIPQYTQSGMWWFTLIFGFLGLHHLLFRSPHTWILFLIVNTVTCGYWWIFDLIQLSNAGGIDLDIYGLESPWGPLGIAQGMFTEWAKYTTPSVGSYQSSARPLAVAAATATAYPTNFATAPPAPPVAPAAAPPPNIQRIVRVADSRAAPKSDV